MADTHIEAGCSLDEGQCVDLIRQLIGRFRGIQTGQARRDEGRADDRPTLHQRIARRRAHLHNDVSCDPVLPPPYHEGHKFQSDRPRQISVQLRARLCENDAVVRCEPSVPTASQKRHANDLETVINSGLANVQDRKMLDIQGMLADGLITLAYGVLHWRLNTSIWPDLPDPDYLDVLPEDDEERRRYKGRRQVYYIDRDGRRHEEPGEGRETKRGYRETQDAYEDRVRRTRAMAGFPYDVEVLQPDQFLYMEDATALNGLALGLVLREVGLMEYSSAVRRSDDLAISLHQVDGSLRIGVEREAPPDWQPSGDLWGQRIQIAELWTRDEYYELIAPENSDGWTLVKACGHPYGMPPFAVAAAHERNETDPALRWEPALEGMYRLKPTLDRAISLFMTLGESVALPFFYLRRISDGQPRLSDDGKVMQFARNAANAMEVPDGYELAQLEFELNPAFIEGIRFITEEFDRSAPATGQAEISTATQPWTARIEQAQKNVEPKLYLKNISRALQTMVRNMAMVMSLPVEDGGTGPVWVFARTDDGDVDYDSIVGIEPDQIRSLNLSVTIEATSSAERITLQEHGRAMLNDPMVGLTLEEFVEEYEGKANADEVVVMRRADQAYRQYIEPGLIRQKIAARLGTQIVIGADGAAVGPNGQPMAWQDVMAANGYSVMHPSPNPPGGGGPPGSTMPTQPALRAPGTVPLPGVAAG